MSMENKTNFIIAVRGYKKTGQQKRANCTDITALDNMNNKVLLRIIEPQDNEYITGNDIKDLIEFVKSENYDKTILVSKKFTDHAVEEMTKENIQLVSDDYMPPFEIEELYLAIVNCANNQCQKKCGKVQSSIFECTENNSHLCRIKALADSAKAHFEDGSVGLLKNDLKVALAIDK
ncbi:MAG: hypothetical protein ACQCN4_11680 [Candidatus Bathyarchaeia archaeon]